MTPEGHAGRLLVATPALVEHGGQVGYFLWLIWIVGASIVLGRGERARAQLSQSRSTAGQPPNSDPAASCV